MVDPTLNPFQSGFGRFQKEPSEKLMKELEILLSVDSKIRASLRPKVNENLEDSATVEELCIFYKHGSFSEKSRETCIGEKAIIEVVLSVRYQKVPAVRKFFDKHLMTEKNFLIGTGYLAKKLDYKVFDALMNDYENLSLFLLRNLDKVETSPNFIKWMVANLETAAPHIVKQKFHLKKFEFDFLDSLLKGVNDYVSRSVCPSIFAMALFRKEDVSEFAILKFVAACDSGDCDVIETLYVYKEIDPITYSRELFLCFKNDKEMTKFLLQRASQQDMGIVCSDNETEVQLLMGLKRDSTKKQMTKLYQLHKNDALIKMRASRSLPYTDYKAKKLHNTPKF